MTFDTELKLLDNTPAIAFGYSGKVSEGSRLSGDQIDWTFWKRPGQRSKE
jgi:hypothetical protein